jgi:hypothetical protein
VGGWVQKIKIRTSYLIARFVANLQKRSKRGGVLVAISQQGFIAKIAEYPRQAKKLGTKEWTLENTNNLF